MALVEQRIGYGLKVQDIIVGFPTAPKISFYFFSSFHTRSRYHAASYIIGTAGSLTCE
jgi:hypothetical protein